MDQCVRGSKGQRKEASEDQMIDGLKVHTRIIFKGQEDLSFKRKDQWISG